EDSQYAVAATIPPQGESRRLYAYRYEFDVPTGATIDSIDLRVVRRFAGSGTIVDQAVRLMESDTQPIGQDKSTTSLWPADFDSATYTWGWSGFTEELINSNAFGAVVRARNSHSSSNATARVDYLELTVGYSCD
ncbi:MAG: hypothetical protein JRI68_02215, partial [Deltaproteobacteria bacterium]|nr:hypothetical protein [Deltaproteobacteria bacterium]